MIRNNVKQILDTLPKGVSLVAAAKTRTYDEIKEVIEAGVRIIGENYVQEAEDVFPKIGNASVKWHFIGHLQRNKVKKAVRIFDVIETVDSLRLAKEIDKQSKVIGETRDVFIEVNSGKEEQKFGVFPEDVEPLIKQVSGLGNVKVTGLMTMGPFDGDPEKARPCFKATKQIFDDIKEKNIDNVNMEYLSMGMTNTYKIAIEEGANIVRIGTLIFGERDYGKE